MKTFLKSVMILALIITAFSCDSEDDGSTTTGNTDEFFKYTIDGMERIFDFDTESHLEIQSSSTTISSFDISSLGEQPDGSFRRVSATFFFDKNGPLLPTSTYNWGYPDSNISPSFFFTESTITNLFVISPDPAVNPIMTNITSSIPNNVGDYIEFMFSGTFIENGITKNIFGECRAQRDADQNF